MRHMMPLVRVDGRDYTWIPELELYAPVVLVKEKENEEK